MSWNKYMYRIGKLFVGFLIFSVSIMNPVSGQESLPVSHLTSTDRLDYSAAFVIGMSQNEGASYVDRVLKDSAFELFGTLVPDPAHVGAAADVYLLLRINNSFYVKTTDGSLQRWDLKVSTLRPFIENTTLSDENLYSLYQGTISDNGQLRVYAGYKTNDSGLIYMPKPRKFSIDVPLASSYDLPQNTYLPDVMEQYANQCIDEPDPFSFTLIRMVGCFNQYARRTGKWSYYDPATQVLTHHVYYDDGLITGPVELFLQGTLRVRYELQNGLRDGLVQLFDESGNLEKEELWENGFRITPALAADNLVIPRFDAALLHYMPLDSQDNVEDCEALDGNVASGRYQQGCWNEGYTPQDKVQRGWWRTYEAGLLRELAYWSEALYISINLAHQGSSISLQNLTENNAGRIDHNLTFRNSAVSSLQLRDYDSSITYVSTYNHDQPEIYLERTFTLVNGARDGEETIYNAAGEIVDVIDHVAPVPSSRPISSGPTCVYDIETQRYTNEVCLHKNDDQAGAYVDSVFGDAGEWGIETGDPYCPGNKDGYCFVDYTATCPGGTTYGGSVPYKSELGKRLKIQLALAATCNQIDDLLRTYQECKAAFGREDCLEP